MLHSVGRGLTESRACDGIGGGVRKRKVLPKPHDPWGEARGLISVSLAFSRTPVYTARSQIHNERIVQCASVYAPDFAGTHCPCPRRDGQAESEE